MKVLLVGAITTGTAVIIAGGPLWAAFGFAASVIWASLGASELVRLNGGK